MKIVRAGQNDFPALEPLVEALALELGEMDESFSIREGMLDQAFGALKSLVLEALIKPDRAVFAAFDEGKAVGFIVVLIRERAPFLGGAPRFGFITDLYVVPPRRRRDLAAGLFEKAEEWCLERSVDRIGGGISLKNSASLRAAKKRGYAEEVVTVFRNLK